MTHFVPNESEVGAVLRPFQIRNTCAGSNFSTALRTKRCYASTYL